MARAVECRLSTSHGLDKVGAPIAAQVFLLFRRHSSDFSSAARVDGLELGGDDVRWWGWSVGRRFRGEEAGDERFLEAGGSCIGGEAGEVDVKQLLPHSACHCCVTFTCLVVVAMGVVRGAEGTVGILANYDFIDKDFVT